MLKRTLLFLTAVVVFIPFVALAQNSGLAGDVEVALADGTSVAIKDVKVGSYTYAFDSRVNHRVTRRIVKQISGYETEWYRINDSIEAAPRHRFWVDGKWVEARSLRLGQNLQDLEGKPVQITQLNLIREKRVRFNILVDELNNYYVGGVLVSSFVHNSP